MFFSLLLKQGDFGNCIHKLWIICFIYINFCVSSIIILIMKTDRVNYYRWESKRFLKLRIVNEENGTSI